MDDRPHAAEVVGDVVADAGLGEATALERRALERERPAGVAPISEWPAVHKSGSGGVQCRDLRTVGHVGVLRLQRGPL